MTQISIPLTLPDAKTAGLVICAGLIGFLYYRHMLLQGELHQARRQTRDTLHRVTALEQRVEELPAIQAPRITLPPVRSAIPPAAQTQAEGSKNAHLASRPPPSSHRVINQPRYASMGHVDPATISGREQFITPRPEAGFDAGVELDDETRQRIAEIVRMRTESGASSLD